MKTTLLLSTLLFCAGSVWGYVEPKPVKASHIFKLTPPAIKKVTPQGAAILQTLSFPISPRGADVWLHLYADAPSLFRPSDVFGASPDKGDYIGDDRLKKHRFINGKIALLTSGRLDLFLRRGTRFIRIQTLKFKRPEEAQDFSPEGLPISELDVFALGDVYWLDKKKTRPVITLQIPGYWDREGNFVLFIFNKGITQPPIRQDFHYFTGDFSRREVEFTSYDK